MKLTKAEKVRLGTFVFSGLALFVGGVVSLAGLSVIERRDVYKVSFSESVSGLEVSAQVKYQGFRVGTVSDMSIDPNNPSNIEVTLALEKGTKLHEGTQAVLDLSGITGLKTINLTPGDARKPLIEPGSRLPAGQSLVDKITGRADVITLKVEEIANNLATWTSEENRVRLEHLLEGTARLVDDVDLFIVETREPLVNALEEGAATMQVMRGLSGQADSTLKEMERTLAVARGAIGEAQRILAAVDSKTVKQTFTSANAAMVSLDRRLSDEELGKALVSLQSALNEVTKLLGEMDVAVRASREDFVASLKAIREASEDLREFSRIIAQDPSVLLRGTEETE
jgi:phospholipid/cholesterol/gamma-HCH transport system substrate-binding protein